MREFFHGWKRKVGCVTLILACVFAAGWVRSGEIKDTFVHRIDRRSTHSIVTNLSHIYWMRQREARPMQIRFNYWHWAGSVEMRGIFPTEHYDLEPNWKLVGFEIGKALLRNLRPPLDYEYWIIPYWPIVLPLTAVSAWLLLSKPRAKSDQRVTSASENA